MNLFVWLSPGRGYISIPLSKPGYRGVRWQWRSPFLGHVLWNHHSEPPAAWWSNEGNLKETSKQGKSLGLPPLSPEIFVTDQNTLLVLWLYNISWVRSLGFQVHSKWMVDLQRWSWSGLQSRFSIRFASVAATFFVTRQCEELLRGGIGLFNDFILVWRRGMPLSSAFQWINRIWKVKWKKQNICWQWSKFQGLISEMCEKHDQLEKERKFI